MGSWQKFLKRSVVLDLPVSAADSAREGEGSSRTWRYVRKEGRSPSPGRLCQVLLTLEMLQKRILPLSTPFPIQLEISSAEKDKSLGQVTQTRKAVYLWSPQMSSRIDHVGINLSCASYSLET